MENLETLRYGERSKEELLTYLGAYKYHPSFSPQAKPFLTNETTFRYTGFAFRLYSGHNPNNELFILDRTCARLQGSMFFLEKLGRHINHHHVLPQSFRTDRHQCLLWSNEQLNKMIRTARRTMNLQSNMNSSVSFKKIQNC